jgi:hypothetical protein
LHTIRNILNYSCRRFKRVLEEEAAAMQTPKESWETYPRQFACIIVSQTDVDRVLEGVDSDEWYKKGCVTLLRLGMYADEELLKVKRDEDKEDILFLDLSIVFPRGYSMLGSLGWDWMCEHEDDI